MENERTTIEEGVVIEYQGRYWGTEYSDGKSHSENWGKLSEARIYNPEFLKKPEDATYTGSWLVKELQKGRLIPIKRTIQITDELS